MALMSLPMHCVSAACDSPGLPYFELQNHIHSLGTSTLPRPHLTCSLLHTHTHTQLHIPHTDTYTTPLFYIRFQITFNSSVRFIGYFIMSITNGSCRKTFKIPKKIYNYFYSHVVMYLTHSVSNR